MVRIVFILLTASLCGFAADDAFSGQWKLDRAKCTSRVNSLPPADLTTTIELTTDGAKITDDFTGLTSQQKRRVVRTLKFDGKDYPVVGSTRPSATASAKRLDPRTIDFVSKAEGKPVGESHWTVSADGNTLIMTGWMTTPTGERNEYKNVYTH